MTSRRKFIKGAAALSALTFVSPLFARRGSDPKTGLALYTIRNEMGQDAVAALKKVASIGFNWVESAGYSDRMFYGMKPDDFTKLCSSYGLEHISAHLGINEGNLNELAEDCARAGLKYGILPSLPGSLTSDLDGFRKAAEFMNKAGETFKAAGLKFVFHNHTVEFKKQDNIIPFDILLAETDKNLVTFELDLCWMTAAGVDPATYIANNPGRFELWHFKDMTADKRDATMGEGVIDFNPIIKQREKSGLKYHFIEQDNCLTHSPLESIEISRRFLLKKL